MKAKETILGLVSRIETAFSKDDIASADRQVLETTLISVYESLCDLADSSVDWWERDDDALAQIRERITNKA